MYDLFGTIYDQPCRETRNTSEKLIFFASENVVTLADQTFSSYTIAI